jgi:hypothetical protein
LTYLLANFFWSSYVVYFARGNAGAPALLARLNACMGAARPSGIYIILFTSLAQPVIFIVVLLFAADFVS